MYKVEFSEESLKIMSKMDPYTKRILYESIIKKLDGCENPRYLGEPLVGNLKGSWRYRIGDYRVLAKIFDDKLIIYVVTIGHRREVYK